MASNISRKISINSIFDYVPRSLRRLPEISNHYVTVGINGITETNTDGVITHFMFKNNGVTEKRQIQYAVEWLKKHADLTYASIYINHACDATKSHECICFQEIIEALGINHHRLRYLVLAQEAFISNPSNLQNYLINSALETLVITYYAFNKQRETEEGIATLIRTSKHLRRLSLTNCSFSGIGMIKINGSLANNTLLERLEFVGSRRDADAPRLDRIQFADDCALLLSTMTRHLGLQSINLRKTPTHATFMTMVNLALSSRLKSINISGINVPCIILEKFLETLDTTCALTHLDISENHITPQTINMIGSMIRLNLKIKHLVMDKMLLVRRDGDFHINATPNVDTEIKQEFLRAFDFLARCLATNTRLERLDFEGYGETLYRWREFPDNPISLVISCLHKNRGLRHLSLGKDEINNGVFDCIVDALQNNAGYLKKLHIYKHRLGADQIRSLIRMAEIFGFRVIF